MADEESKARVPLLIGGLTLLLAAGLGLRGGCGGAGPSQPDADIAAAASAALAGAAAPSGQAPSGQAPSGGAAASALAGATASAEQPAERPDLTGPTIGERLSAQGAGAHALVVRQGRVWWIDADGQVGALSLATETAADAADAGAGTAAAGTAADVEDAAAPPLIQAAEPDHFGGALAAAEHGVYWIIKPLVDGEDVVYRAQQASAAAVVKVAAAPGIEALLVNAAAVVWSAGEEWSLFDPREGVIRTLQPLDGRVVTAAEHDGSWWWLQADAGGRQRLHALRSEGGAATIWLSDLSAASRSQLTVTSAGLLWLEATDGAGEQWRRWRRGGGVDTVAEVGVVSASVLVGDALVFAELHDVPATKVGAKAGDEGDEGAAVVTVLRRLELGAQPTAPRQFGLQPGRVTALSWHDGVLLWAHDGGISRVPLTVAGTP